MVSSVPSDYDAVIIAAPTTDFLGGELDALSEFLENDGKLGKGLLFFASDSAPYLTNLYDFLSQWGISVGEGVLFETNSQNHIPDDPMTMGVYPASSDNDITSGMQLCITGHNVPFTTAFDSEGSITVTKRRPWEPRPTGRVRIITQSRRIPLLSRPRKWNTTTIITKLQAMFLRLTATSL